MDKTKIDWADSTWNPVTGCLHGCEYCYARGIAHRFMPHEFELMDIMDCPPIIPISAANLGCYECEKPVLLKKFNGEKIRITPYPQGFKPTFHRYRLDDYKKKSGRNIFTVSMGDLFGDWVPDEWIQEVLKACEAAPQHNYLFLTKNPSRYDELYKSKAFLYRENFWFGTSITGPNQMYIRFYDTPYHSFVSLEPILERVDISVAINKPEWLIVGAETGNRKGKVMPKREWVESIVSQCRASDVPIFMKESLRELMGDDFTQEWPDGLKGERL